MKTVVIYVRGGVPEVIAKPRDVYVLIVDWDESREGVCPACRRSLTVYEDSTTGIHTTCETAVKRTVEKTQQEWEEGND